MEAAFTRNHYYPGKLLHADDFVNEQKYFNEKLQFINRRFHGCGIIEGLEVSAKGENRLKLKAGSALDSQGRIIVVPENKVLEASDIEGLAQIEEQDFILGICYAEKASGQERYLFKEEEKYHAARISESFSLKAYRLEEWQRQRLDLSGLGMGAGLTQRQTLYENDAVRLILEMPALVPSDSIFRLRVRAEVLAGKDTAVGWRIMAKLQGGRFLESGYRHQLLTGGEAKQEGKGRQEWDVCTDEKRLLPIVLELDRLEILQDGEKQERTENYQFYIETSENYREAVRESDVNERKRKAVHGAACGEWLPLSHLRMAWQGEAVVFQKIKDRGIRFYARNSREDEMLLGAMEENGIVDIRWRSLLKTARQEPVSPRPPFSPVPKQPFSPVPKQPFSPVPNQPFDPVPEQPFEPIPHPPFDPMLEPVAKPVPESSSGPGQRLPFPEPLHSREKPQDIPGISALRNLENNRLWNWQQERLKELLETERKTHICRGVAVISVPKHYRCGQILYSEEISHGFPGEEVLLWCGRVWEERNYAYWDRDKSKYSVTYGADDLFPELNRNGWGIKKQAICQDVDKGTFRIAIILLKGRRRNWEEEVAISWVACRIV